MGISVRIIAKNEAANIAACLESVAWADEIVVVDAFSTDDTVAICRQYTSKVYQREWDDYSSQKNYGDSLCTQDWILSIDADERVTPALRREIGAATSCSAYVAYRIYIRDYMFGKWIEHGSWPNQCHIRLYRRGQAHWDAVVHESIVSEGPVGTLAAPLTHVSHTSIRKFVDKMNLYTDLEARRNYEAGIRRPLTRAAASGIRQFLYQYIRCKGFLDGRHGFVLATLMGMYRFLLWAKVWELWFSAEQRELGDSRAENVR